MSSEWRMVSLAECAELDLGYPFKSVDYTDSEDDIRLLRGDNIAQGQLRWDGVRRWRRKDGDKLASYQLSENDLVLAMDRPWITAGLKFARVRRSDLPSLLVQRVARLRPKAGVDADYLHSVIASADFTRHIQTITTGTAVPHISGKQIQEYKFNIPDIATQRSIGSLLIAFDDRITLLRETNATLEAIAQALFKSWFVDFDPVRAKMEGRAPEGMDEATAALFPEGFDESELGLVPTGWAIHTMADVSTVGIGKTPPRKEQHWFSEDSNDIRWVSIRDMGAVGVYAAQTSEFLKKEAVEKFNVRRVPDNTVLMSFKMTIGRVAITDGEMTTNEAIAHFKLAPDVQLSTEYIYLHLKQFDFSTLSSTSSIADAVNSKTVREIPILVPSFEVSIAFQRQVTALFAKLKNTEQQAKTLATLRDTLLPRLISGQLRLPEAQTAAEEALA